MCGTIGLFVACPFESFCPEKSLTLAHNDLGEATYKSKLQDWDSKSSVRAQPRRIVSASEIGKSLYFPPEFVPISQHKSILCLGPKYSEEVVIQHLYRYLSFTVKLEHLVVNRTALAIAHGQLGFAFPEEMIFDAYKLYSDEAYHALFCADIIRQVKSINHIEPKLLPTPHFIDRLSEIQHSLPDPQLRGLAELFFVIVSETLISATLSQVPHHRNVIGAVREAVSDHAEDEGRHHAYFASLLRIIWPQLTSAQQRAMGVIVPKFILAFLSPDLDGLRYELTHYGLSTHSIEETISEVYPPQLITENARFAAKSTIRYFEDIGALEHSVVQDAFLRSGLISQPLEAKAFSFS